MSLMAFFLFRIFFLISQLTLTKSMPLVVNGQQGPVSGGSETQWVNQHKIKVRGESVPRCIIQGVKMELTLSEYKIIVRAEHIVDRTENRTETGPKFRSKARTETDSVRSSAQAIPVFRSSVRSKTDQNPVRTEWTEKI